MTKAGNGGKNPDEIDRPELEQLLADGRALFHEAVRLQTKPGDVVVALAVALAVVYESHCLPPGETPRIFAQRIASTLENLIRSGAGK